MAQKIYVAYFAILCNDFLITTAPILGFAKGYQEGQNTEFSGHPDPEKREEGFYLPVNGCHALGLLRRKSQPGV